MFKFQRFLLPLPEAATGQCPDDVETVGKYHLSNSMLFQPFRGLPASPPHEAVSYTTGHPEAIYYFRRPSVPVQRVVSLLRLHSSWQS